MSGMTTASYVTLAAMAASAAGNYIQTKNNNESTQAQIVARNEALAQGVDQQKKNQAQAGDILNTTLQKFTPNQQNSDLANVAATRTATINNNTANTPATGNEANISNAPQVVKDDLASHLGAAAAYGAQQNAALGKMGATNDQFLGNNLGINQGQLGIGTVDNFAAGDARVTQARENAAFNNARKAPSAFGQALSTLGTAAGLYGAVGAPGLNGLVGAGPTNGIGDLIYGPAQNVAPQALPGTGVWGGISPTNPGVPFAA